MSEELTRRDFLKVVEAGAAASLLKMLSDSEGGPAWPEIDGGDLEHLRAVGVQLDIPDRKKPYVTHEGETLAAITRDTGLGDLVAVENGLYPMSPQLPLPPGEILLVPEILDVPLPPADELKTALSRGLFPRVVLNPAIGQTEQFSFWEQVFLGQEARRAVNIADKYLPTPGVRGVVSVMRQPRRTIEQYARKFGWTEDGLMAKKGFVQGDTFFVYSANQTMSFYRDSGTTEMKFRDTRASNQVYLRRIVLTRQPDTVLRTALQQRPFKLTPDWMEYRKDQRNVIVHELLHLYLPDELQLPPFDTHTIIRALTVMIVDKMEGRGQLRGVSQEILGKGEYLLLQKHPPFYRDLVDRLTAGRSLSMFRFAERDVRAAADDIFQKNAGLGQLGNGFDDWWKKVRATTTKREGGVGQ